jgi:hypothetical protein
MMLSRVTSNAALMVAVLTYLLLASASAARKAPWEDEGFINSVAHNLRVAGRMSSPMLEPGGLGYIVLPEVEKYTYYHMPVYFLLQAAWGHFVTLSPLGIRSLSILAGLLGLLAWAVTFRTLLDPIKALVATLLLSIDYLFVLNASTARQDMLSAAFAAIGYASYLSLRARTLAKALDRPRSESEPSDRRPGHHARNPCPSVPGGRWGAGPGPGAGRCACAAGRACGAATRRADKADAPACG